MAEFGPAPQRDPAFRSKDWLLVGPGEEPRRPTRRHLRWLGDLAWVLLIAGLAFFGWRRWGQRPAQGAIEGRVVDLRGQAVAGAQVRLGGPERQTFTASDGRFTIEAVPSGEYWLTVEIPGQSGLRMPVLVQPGAVTRAGNLAIFSPGG